MRTLPVFDPFSEFDRLFEGFVPERARLSGGNGNLVPLDIYESEGQWVLKASLPGIKPEDIDVSIEKNLLTVRGQLNFDEEHKDAKVYRREIASGSFVRSVRLPEDVDVEKVEATFDNGFVTVTLPRTTENKAAIKVPVKSIEASKN